MDVRVSTTSSTNDHHVSLCSRLFASAAMSPQTLVDSGRCTTGPPLRAANPRWSQIFLATTPAVTSAKGSASPDSRVPAENSAGTSSGRKARLSPLIGKYAPTGTVSSSKRTSALAALAASLETASRSASPRQRP